jgi:hypothetical protein
VVSGGVKVLTLRPAMFLCISFIIPYVNVFLTFFYNLIKILLIALFLMFLYLFEGWVVVVAMVQNE